MPLEGRKLLSKHPLIEPSVSPPTSPTHTFRSFSSLSIPHPPLLSSDRSYQRDILVFFSLLHRSLIFISNMTNAENTSPSNNAPFRIKPRDKACLDKWWSLSEKQRYKTDVSLHTSDFDFNEEGECKPLQSVSGTALHIVVDRHSTRAIKNLIKFQSALFYGKLKVTTAWDGEGARPIFLKDLLTVCQGIPEATRGHLWEIELNQGSGSAVSPTGLNLPKEGTPGLTGGKNTINLNLLTESTEGGDSLAKHIIHGAAADTDVSGRCICEAIDYFEASRQPRQERTRHPDYHFRNLTKIELSHDQGQTALNELPVHCYLKKKKMHESFRNRGPLDDCSVLSRLLTRIDSRSTFDGVKVYEWDTHGYWVGADGVPVECSDSDTDSDQSD